MSASMLDKNDAEPISEEDLFADQPDDAAVAEFAWLDEQLAADKAIPTKDDGDFVEIDIDPIPTLYDVVERAITVSPDDIDGDAPQEPVLEDVDDVTLPTEQPASALELAADGDLQAGIDSAAPYIDADTQEVELSTAMLTMAADAETQAKLDEPDVDPRDVTDVTYADHYDAANQPPVQSLENVFNLASYQPVQLQRGLMGVACTFLIIAGAALWRAVNGRVIVTELVPPLVYAVIGVVVYLLGMRYLRIHFAQVRVSDKDWLLCEQVMVAADNGVMLKARFGTVYLVWEQLLGVAHDSDYYYLLIEPAQGFKVPKLGVSDPTLQVKLDDMASLTRAKAWQYN